LPVVGSHFYGTTYYGGGSGNCVEGCGTVFKITPNGTLTTLHAFMRKKRNPPSLQNKEWISSTSRKQWRLQREMWNQAEAN
jgi:uncharacterized repeat protein (TIGR03803 family)